MSENSRITEIKEVIENEMAVMLYFFNDHCAPCQALRPKVEELLQTTFPKMKLIFINSSERELNTAYGIYENPTLLVFFDRKEFLRYSKYVSIAQLESAIHKYYSMIF